jgi:hypothetical protein
MRLLPAFLVFLCASISWAAGNPAAFAPLALLKGQVLEVKDVESYTYLRLKTRDGETWAAVARAPVRIGADVTIDNAMLMEGFESKTLGRKFDRIFFGSLAGAGGGAAMHGGIPAATVGNVAVAKASGPDARTVAQVITERAALRDRKVQVRGTVVKFSGEILGRNWLHLQDGSGSAADNTNDLLVTTRDQAKPGDVVIARGVVVTDKDFGSGYSYRVLIGDATLQK